MIEHRLYLYALDPTHIGAGGHRLGRVDATILREPATELPKIPGSSTAGVTRTAAIYSLPTEEERKQARQFARDVLDHPDANIGCGKNDPVAKYFGYAEGEGGENRIGLLSFYDAHILAFPVSTLAGPRWITTAAILNELGLAADGPADIGQVKVNATSSPKRINLGSYLLQAEPASIPFPQTLLPSKDASGIRGMDHVKQRLVLVHEDLFPRLVNANLETRSSVVIDFETGAPAEKLLFSYEATPRGTLFAGSIAIDDDRFPDLAKTAEKRLEPALALACRWGLGGMTTRGFGRMRPLLVKRRAAC